jgi:hypothetical protein
LTLEQFGESECVGEFSLIIIRIAAMTTDPLRTFDQTGKHDSTVPECFTPGPMETFLGLNRVHIRFLNEGRSSVVNDRNFAKPNRCCPDGDGGVAHQADCTDGVSHAVLRAAGEPLSSQWRHGSGIARHVVAGFACAVDETNLLEIFFHSQSVCVAAFASRRKFSGNNSVRILQGVTTIESCSGRTTARETIERKQEAELRLVRHPRRKGIHENRNDDQRSPAGRESHCDCRRRRAGGTLR